MQIIPGPDVDLISPFPTNQAHRVYGWVQCFKSMQITDDSPKTKEAFDSLVLDYVNSMESFGVVDRNNRLKLKHPIPLVGMLAFAQAGPVNKYIHFTSSRTARGTGIMDQALQVAINHIFTTTNAFRVSAMILNQNRPAREFLKRNGFKFEGVFKDMASQNGLPVDMIHFGVYRDSWKFMPKDLHIKEDN